MFSMLVRAVDPVSDTNTHTMCFIWAVQKIEKIRKSAVPFTPAGSVLTTLCEHLTWAMKMTVKA